jgi:stress response protein YsnF
MNESKGHGEYTSTDRSNTTNIPVVEETIQIKRELIDKGRIRFTKKVDEETVEIPLTSTTQQYSIERISVNRYVEEAPPGIRYEGKTMIISIIEEEAVIQKRLKIVEELHITSAEIETRTKTEVNLKKERIIIKKDPET